MKQPKVIRFRCHCFECSNDDEPERDGLPPGATEIDQDNKKSGEADAHLIQNAIEKLLFGA
jgi:hypothetical protein